MYIIHVHTERTLSGSLLHPPLYFHCCARGATTLSDGLRLRWKKKKKKKRKEEGGGFERDGREGGGGGRIGLRRPRLCSDVTKQTDTREAPYINIYSPPLLLFLFFFMEQLPITMEKKKEKKKFE